MYYLFLSGLIPEQKRSEFEQTYFLVSTQMPVSCAGYWFETDMVEHGKYYFVSYWASQEAIESFRKTPGYLMLNGAFATLGKLLENSIGEMKTPFRHHS
jgi:quinol monooxygenase YgiN